MNWFKKVWTALSTAPYRNPEGFEISPHSLTPRANQVLALARREAHRLHHGFVGTEHLLLGLIGLESGIIAAILGRMGVDIRRAREEVEKQIGSGTSDAQSKSTDYLPYTPRVVKALGLAAKHSRALNHTYIGTEHIFLGLIAEGDSVACRIMACLGADPNKARIAVLQELGAVLNGPPPDASVPSSNVTDGRLHIPPDTSAMPSATPTAVIPVDTTRRYDVYCIEADQRMVVYRDVLFKGRHGLFGGDGISANSQFLELEMRNGQSVFVSAVCVIKFCDCGADACGGAAHPQDL